MDEISARLHLSSSISFYQQYIEGIVTLFLNVKEKSQEENWMS